MWRYLGVGVVMGLACGCTTPNPKSCADGACSDPALPFCDVDGAVAGSPMACIAVSCTPAEVAVCRGDEAVTCNSTGNDYDVVPCPLGCNVAVGGCRTCATNNDCAASTPICDETTSQCRGCAADSECESSVCGQGSCVPSSSIVYANSTGSNVATGTMADPASISRAIVLAFAGGGPPKIVRLLPGAYNTPIEMLTENLMPLEIVATGATISANDVGVQVRGGANLKIRGISVTGANQAVTCGAGGDLLTNLSIESSLFFQTTSSNVGRMIVTNCVLKMTNVESRSTLSTESLFFLGNNTRFVGDRLFLHGPNASLYMQGSGVSVRMTNSVLDDVSLVINTNDTTGVGSEAYLGFNTIVMEAPSINFDCNAVTNPALLRRVLENNIIVANGASSAIGGTGCTLTNNLINPQPNPPAGNIVSDPQFVDVAARNFRLRPTSPALGAASTTPTIFTDHDFEGRSRPQGTGADIGAFEQ